MEPEEFAELITSLQKDLYGYIYSVSGSSTGAWDILQETNLVLWKKRGEFHPGSNFSAWAYTVARFQCMAYFRDRKRDPHQLVTPELLEIFGEEPDQQHQQGKALYAALQHCQEKLEERSRNLLKLYYHDRLSLEQIGARLDQKPNALKQALFRIRRSLRKCIEHQLQKS